VNLKKRDMSQGLIDYLRLNIGNYPLGAGEVFCLAPESTVYYTRLKNMGVPSNKLFTTLAEAEDAMVSNSGDNLLIFPGTHLQTASLTWDKNDTTIIGVGSINQRFQPSAMTGGGVRLKIATAVAQILDITGSYVSMYNIGTQNTADSATSVSDIRIKGRNFYAKHCAFRGGTGATQIGTADCGVGVYVDSTVAGAGNGLVFERCLFGSSGNTIRTVGACCASFVGGTTAAGFEPLFLDCEFSGWTVTAGVGFINVNSDACTDRFLTFRRCSFLNFGNPATPMTNAILWNNQTGWCIIDKCVGFGFTKWYTGTDNHLYVSDPAANGSGGITTISA
jgi:hypothetical protein